MASLESTPAENITNENRDQINDDDDDDQFNVSDKIVPTIYNTTTQEPHKTDVTTTEGNESNERNVDMENLIKKDPEKYIYATIPKEYSGLVHCNVKRSKEGLISKTFSLHFDGLKENDQTFLLTARKHIKMNGHSEYYMGNDEKSSKSLTDENSIARLKAVNITSTEYIFYNQNNQQSVAIIYDTPLSALRAPRKLTVLLYDVEKTDHPLKENESIIEEWRSGRANNLIEIKNKTPVYNKDNKEYSINLFESRAKQPSHKSFQLVMTNGDHEQIIMQFGRIDDNTFALDYRYPLAAMQAFAIALSAFHNRFRT